MATFLAGSGYDAGVCLCVVWPKTVGTSLTFMPLRLGL